MMPIRQGDGTGISDVRLGDGTRIAEVRKGDGTVLWSAGADIPDSGVSRWTFDNEDTNAGTAVDVWGNNDGTINGATTGATGLSGYDSGQAYSFQTDDYIALPVTPPATCSLSIWAQPDNLSDTMAFYSSRNGGNGLIIRSEGSQWAGFANDGTFQSVKGGSPSSSSPDHLVLTVDNQNQIEFYVNGSSLGTSGIGNRLTGVDLNVGRSAADSNYVDGDADDPSLYNKVLSDTEVSNLYNTGSING